MVGVKLHEDETYSDKVYAPGYGEFFSAHGGDVEAMALVVPTYVLSEPLRDETDLARFDVWARRIVVDAAADDLAGVRSDLATLEWIRDRFADALTGADLTRIDAHLEALRIAVDDEDLAAATDEAERLRATLGRLQG